MESLCGSTCSVFKLRARYYAPGVGRFLTKDIWDGNVKSPMSFNRWDYVGANPVNQTDPSGHCWYPNLENGGVSYDITDPSPSLCAWFTNNFPTVPTNSTPHNWLDSLPLGVISLVSSYSDCTIKVILSWHRVKIIGWHKWRSDTTVPTRRVGTSDD